MKKKKISIEKYLELDKRDQKEISLLEDQLKKAREENEHLHQLIRIIRSKRINLEELERLGLQRYNAKYGKRGSHPFYLGFWSFEEDSTFVSDFLYEELKKYYFIYVKPCVKRSYTEGIKRQ